MNQEIVIATNNEHKVQEYREIFKGCPIVFYSLKDLNIKDEPLEDGNSYRENALIKARSIAKYTTLPILADDSGLEIESLNNEPGLFSARYSKEMGGQEKANLSIISRLNGINNRNACFKCTIALINVKEGELIYEGTAKGYILNAPQGHNGFGYDPIFFSSEANAPFALLSGDLKNKFSHRGKASLKLKSYLIIKNYKLG
jgi:non-canonical purine NTP pyrophosphatase (RdgB/HAM1 family)